MTYVEVGAARTAVGSGLVQNGIPKASFLSNLYHIWRTNKLLVPNGWSDLSWIFFSFVGLIYICYCVCIHLVLGSVPWNEWSFFGGWKHGQGSCVGLYMINRPEWVITELACGSYSYISVPLYDTLGMLTKPSVMNTLIAIVSKPQLVFLAQISDDELF